MNGDSNSLFKIFRVLWFPISINAMALGAVAVILFHLGTGAACWMAGDRGLGTTATSGFLTASSRMLATGTWPGYATAENAEGRIVHEALAKDGLGPAHAAEDLALVESALGPYFRKRAAAIEADRDLDAAKKKEALDGLERVKGRFRWIYAFQVIAFFALLATFGVAICRVIALRISRDEYCTLSSAFSYAWRVKLTGLLFPVAVALPMLFLAGCNFFIGTLSQIPYVGWFFGLVPLPLVFVASLLIILIGIGGIVSIGLVPAAIAIERKGTYDSLGKTFNYIFARPLPLILYLLMLREFLELVARLLVEWRLVEHVMGATLSPFWNNETYEKIVAGDSGAAGLNGFESFCAWLYGVVLTGFHVLVWGALVSYALGAATSMFLVFRKDVDGLDYVDVARDPFEAAPAPSAAEVAPATPPAV